MGSAHTNDDRRREGRRSSVLGPERLGHSGSASAGVPARRRAAIRTIASRAWESDGRRPPPS